MIERRSIEKQDSPFEKLNTKGIRVFVCSFYASSSWTTDHSIKVIDKPTEELADRKPVVIASNVNACGGAV